MHLCLTPASMTGSVATCARMCADADWLEAVSTSHHPSPNHDLCCRLLSHIPLLAAYTGWPSEHHRSSESEAGTQNTKDSNGGTGVTERANEGVVDTDLGSEDQPTTWRPSDEDKKYIEETVRSLVDREDLCRLLMIAMATELERLTSGEDGDQSDAKSPTHIIQFTAECPPEEFDHGDTAHEAYKCERSNSQEICKIESTNTAAFEHFSEELAENAGCGWETAGDGESVRTGVIVFEDATSDSLESARSNAPPSINIASVSAENPLPDVTDTGDLTAQDLHWFDRQCRKTVAPPSKSLDVELLEAIRAAETLIDIRQANSPLSPHQKAVNSTAHGLHQTVDSENGFSPVKPQTLEKTTQEVDGTQVPVDKSKSSLERLLIQNLESLSVGSKHVSAATQKPANTLVELPVQQPLSETQVPLLLTSCTAVSDGDNTDGICTNGDVAVTQPRQLCTVHGEKEEKHDDRYDHDDKYDHDRTLSLGLGPAKLTETAKDRRSERRSVELDDDCRVTFRPLPVPVTSQEAVNHVLASSALRPHNATYARMSRLPQPTGRYRKPRSNPHDVKCAQRRKSVAV